MTTLMIACDKSYQKGGHDISIPLNFSVAKDYFLSNYDYCRRAVKPELLTHSLTHYDYCITIVLVRPAPNVSKPYKHAISCW